MSKAHEDLHESAKALSSETLDLHRALVSLQEELEAVDWYRQRIVACHDKGLKAILGHNMREEMEHAAMVLEWIRRNSPDFDGHLREYLFTDAPIAETQPEPSEDDGKHEEPVSLAAEDRRASLGNLRNLRKSASKEAS